MIYDRFENLGQYTGLFEELDITIDWISSHDLNQLPLGKTAIDGDRIFVNVVDCKTRPSSEAVYETHSRYLDLQIDLKGVELFEVALGKLDEIQPYDEATDTCLCNAELSVAGVLGSERFVLFTLEEAHKPCVRARGCDSVKKAIFKIALN